MADERVIYPAQEETLKEILELLEQIRDAVAPQDDGGE